MRWILGIFEGNRDVAACRGHHLNVCRWLLGTKIQNCAYIDDVTIALQAFSCLQAVSPCLTPDLMSLDSKFNILTLLSYCILAIWGSGNFIDYVFKYHIVCTTIIFTNSVKFSPWWADGQYSRSGIPKFFPSTTFFAEGKKRKGWLGMMCLGMGYVGSWIFRPSIRLCHGALYKSHVCLATLYSYLTEKIVP